MKDIFFSEEIDSVGSARRSIPAIAVEWMQPDSAVSLSSAMLLYAASAWCGIQLGQTSAEADVFWPSNGILIAILLRLQRRYWVSYLAGCFVANIFAHSLFHFPTFQIAFFSLANTVEVTAAALLLSNPDARKPDITQMPTLGRFVLFGVIVAPLLSTGFVKLCLALRSTPVGLLPLSNWFLGDALGIAIMTPLILAIERAELAALFSRNKRAETIGILSGLAVLSCAVFAQTGSPVAFFVFPALLLTIFRLGSSGAGIGVFLIAFPAAYFTGRGRGPFSLMHTGKLIHSIFLLQCFLCVALIIVYCVSSALRERDRLQKELTEAYHEADAQAARDHITGLANRRTFDLELMHEWQRALREKVSLSLLMIDVDRFKLYNDCFGHVAGDECLRSVAAILADAPLRVTDVVARYGGEEFGIILPRALTRGATALAERIRQSVSEACLPHQEGIVTISIGVATFYPAEGLNEKMLIRRADEALYAAKAAGRNRVVAWGEQETRHES